MNRALLRWAALVAALLLALAACGSDDQTAGTDDATATTTAAADTSDPAPVAGEHDHDELVDASDRDPAPSLELEVLVDDQSGFNVHAVAVNHEISAEAASTDHVDGEGHMHLYVDGEKVSRFYNEWLHVGDLEPGDHEFRVELSANSHAALAIDGEPIDQAVTVTQPEREGHSHRPDPTDISVDPLPAVELTVLDDPKSGFNLHAVPSNFTIAPENVNGPNVDGEGHMHLYVDGQKITRLYGEWYHLEDVFGSGDHDVRVELSNNDHSAVAIDGTVVDATGSFTSTTEMDVDNDGDTDHDDGNGHDGHDGGDHDTDAGGDGGHDTDTDHDDDNGDDGHEGDTDHDDGNGDADHAVEITYADGAVVGGPATIEVGTGDTVTLLVSSDIDEEIHVHGADVFGEVSAGETVEITFTAEIPGQFEIELEDRGQLLATLVTT